MVIARSQTVVLITRPLFPKLLHAHNSIITEGKLSAHILWETSAETACVNLMSCIVSSYLELADNLVWLLV